MDRGAAGQQRLDGDAEREREQGDSHGIERPCVVGAFLGDEARHDPRGQQAEGKVGEEDPAPAEPARDRPAQGRAERHRRARDDAREAEGPRAVRRIGIGAGRQRDRTGDHERRPKALCNTRGPQGGPVPRQPAGQRCNGEQRIAGQQGASPAVTIGQRAGGEQGGGEGQAVGVHRPGIGREAEAEIVADRRQGDDDGGDVELGEETREGEGEGRGAPEAFHGGE